MAQKLNKFVAFVIGAVLGPAATIPACGTYGADCSFLYSSVERCHGETWAQSFQASCEACQILGPPNSDYMNCWTDNECVDTNDTDAIKAVNACLDATGNKLCE